MFLTTKYILLPALWSALPILTPFSTRVPTNFFKPPNPTKKEYFLDIASASYFKISSLAQDTLAPPLPWQDPHRVSFIEMQKYNNNAQNSTEHGDALLAHIIEYQANDSMTFDLKKQHFNICGTSTITYGDTKLTAENILLDGSSGTITATGKVDESGQINPKPILQQGNSKYIAETIQYNVESRRGTAKRLFVYQDQTLIRCKNAKMDIEDTQYADRLKFTTCNLTNPHYFVKARDIKFVKDDQITSGPFQFYFAGVPTILGFYYGLFFIPMSKKSGILAPQLGEDGKKGFFLKQGGYYFYFSDYLDLALRGSIYSQGHSNFSAESTYKKRYSFQGKLSYTQEITSNTTELALQEDKEKEWRFQWNNNTENNRISSFVVDVDIQSRSKRHSLQTIGKLDNLNAITQSKIRYTRKILGTPYDLKASAAHSKDFQKDLTNVTFPELVVGTEFIYPFRGSSIPKYQFQNISFRHISEFQNRFNNVVDQDTLEFSNKNWPKILKNNQYGVKHTFPIETNIKLSYFNLKPFADYTERWYFKRYRYTYHAPKDSIVVDTVESFNRVWDYRLGAELQTTVYGTHFFKEKALVQAIRHRIEPSIKLVYNPDFSKKEYGFFQKIQTKKGEKVMDKFQGHVYGSPPSKASALLTLAVDNILEIKTRDNENITKKSKKISLLESLYGKTTYDFLADSFPLGDLQFGVRNRFLDSLISVEYSNKYDPYLYVNRTRIEEFAWQHGRGLGTMKEYAFKLGTHLKSKKHDITPSLTDEDSKTQELDAEKQDLTAKKQPNPEEAVVVLDSTQYVDFDIPWQLNISYQQNFTYNIPLDKSTTIRQINFSGDVNITKNWKATFSSVYDIGTKELVGSATKVGFYRDLHCWQMSFDWVPLASKQSYEFSIGLKAPILEDVKLPHSREYDKV